MVTSVTSRGAPGRGNLGHSILIVDTSNCGSVHQVLIAPQWIKNVSWPDHTVSVKLTRQAVRDAPPYDSAVILDRRGNSLAQHYASARYWADEVKTENPQFRLVKSAAPAAIHKNV